MTNEDWAQIQCKLEQAVGQKLNVQSFNIQRTDTVQLWFDEGYDLDLDILPAIKKFMVNFKEEWVQSWRLFTPAIKQHHRQRMFRKSRTTSFANSKNFNAEDPPRDPRHVRKRAVAEWREKVRPKMQEME